MPRPSPRLIIGLLLLAGLLVTVESLFGWHQLLQPWRQQDASALLLALALVFASYLLRSLRLYSYFHTAISGRFLLCTRLMLQHNLLNNLLPMRTGELSFPLLMKRYFAIPTSQSLPALLWFRLLDLHTLAIFVIVCLPMPWGRGLSLAFALLLLPLPWLFFHFAGRLQQHLADGEHWRARVARLMNGLPQDRQTLFRSWLWTVSNWLIKLLVFAWILQIFVETPFSGALLGAISGDLTSVLPINGVAGAGTYEAGIVAGLLPFGIDARSALAGAVNLHLFVLTATLLGGAISPFLGRQHVSQ